MQIYHDTKLEMILQAKRQLEEKGSSANAIKVSVQELNALREYVEYDEIDSTATILGMVMFVDDGEEPEEEKGNELNVAMDLLNDMIKKRPTVDLEGEEKKVFQSHEIKQ